MSIKIDNNVKNQKQSPALFQDTFANRPPFGQTGRLFFSTDTNVLYRDTGTSWVLFLQNANLSGYVPYSGATGNLSLGSNFLFASDVQTTNSVNSPFLIGNTVTGVNYNFQDPSSVKTLTISQIDKLTQNINAFFQNNNTLNLQSMIPVSKINPQPDGSGNYFLNLQIGDVDENGNFVDCHDVYAFFVKAGEIYTDSMSVIGAISASDVGASTSVTTPILIGDAITGNTYNFKNSSNNKKLTISQNGKLTQNIDAFFQDFKKTNRTSMIPLAIQENTIELDYYTNVQVGSLLDFVLKKIFASDLYVSGNVGIGVEIPTVKLEVNGLVKVGQYTNGTEPAYIKGAQYFNTTINKLKIGGATAWETITSI